LIPVGEEKIGRTDETNQIFRSFFGISGRRDGDINEGSGGGAMDFSGENP